MTDIDTTRLRELHALADKGRPGWAEGNDFLCRIMPKIPALLDAADERDRLKADLAVRDENYATLLKRWKDACSDAVQLRAQLRDLGADPQ